MKKFLLFLAFIFGLTSVYALGLYVLQEKFYIHPDKEYITPKKAGMPNFREVMLEARDGLKIRTWFFNGNEDKPLILFFHGNKSQNAEYATGLTQYIRNGFGVMMMDYREFGGMNGKFSQENIYMDALSTYDYLKKNHSNREIIVMGYSMGTAVASYLSSNRQPDKVILLAPFYSLKEIAGEKNIPLARLVIKYEMPSYKFIKDYKGKLLILHGSKDTLVPYEHGRRLYDLAKNSQRQFIILNNCEHNEVFFDTKKNGHTKVIEWISQN